MKLIVRQYLASLKERDELDAILPDLLSQLGLTVYSRPSKGTRQDGVDVAAVGSLNGNSEKVYLFSIKAGDLNRRSWDGNTLQSLRPSLNEILDAYIPNRLPSEHKEKDIVVCLCFGGDIREEVRPQIEGYIKENRRANLSFEEWNGDKLASLILSNFLHEDLLPQNARSQLRKSLALLDEPEASYQHFSTLVSLFFNKKGTKDKDQVMAIRQINICLWILFAWSRDEGNIESAYLSSELALLHTWEIAKTYFTKKTKSAKVIQLAFESILSVYFQISSLYLNEKILPHILKLHSLSEAVQASSSLDINLKLFDVLGRLAIKGVWLYWLDKNEVEVEIHKSLRNEIQSFSVAVEQLILNNPTLFLPIKDDQAIDISIAMLLLILNNDSHSFIREWLSELVVRTDFSHQIYGQYPCNLSNYSELLEHPQRNNEGYRQKVTSGSILFPMIGLWAALLGESDLYSQVQSLKGKHLNHCNFQFWYPDDDSEKYFYTNKDIHGATLSQVCIDRSLNEFISEAFNECEHSPQFRTLSAVENNIWPIILVACRHYRLPVPLNLWKDLVNSEKSSITSSEE